jgi:hypothetical protein
MNLKTGWAVYIICYLVTLFILTYLFNIANDEPIPLIVWQKTVAASWLLFAIKAIVKFIYYISTLHMGTLRYDTSTMTRFVIPVFEEIVSFVFLHKWLHNMYQVAIVIQTTNLLQLVGHGNYLLTYQYSKTYAKFLRYYDVFAVSPPTSDAFSRPSICSETSLTSENSKLSINDLPKSFTPKLTPVPVTSSDSNSAIIDSLYSVSPKNTYHLNTATAIATIDILDKIEDEYVDPLKGDIPHTSTCDNIDECDDVALKESFSTSIGEFHEFSTTETGSRFVKFVRWWSWLFPFLLESNKVRTRRIPLHHRLSTYSLVGSCSRKNSVISRLSGPAVSDLEAGIQDIHVDTRHPYLRFIEFVTNFCDYRRDQEMRIDPVFVKFGVLLTDIHWIWLFLNMTNITLLSTVSFLSYHYFGAGSLLIIIVLRLFKQNYLYDQMVNINYKIVLPIETVISAILLSIYFFYIYTTSL